MNNSRSGRLDDNRESLVVIPPLLHGPFLYASIMFEWIGGDMGYTKDLENIQHVRFHSPAINIDISLLFADFYFSLAQSGAAHHPSRSFKSIY